MTYGTSEIKNDSGIADEYFEKYKSLAKKDDVEAFMYLAKAANLWNKDAVKRVIGLYSKGFCLDCFRRPALRAAAKECKNPEKAVAYGLEAENHGVNVAWDLMYAYIETENYEQALYWAKIYDSRQDNPKAVARMEEKSKELASEAMNYYNQNDYQQALVFFEKAAKLENANAQYMCGMMYDSGCGTMKNEVQALFWYEKAAHLGNESAKSKLEEYKIKTRATQGDAEAQYAYAKKLEWRDMAEAFAFYLKAAQQGHKKAQFETGLCYAVGNGTKKNSQEALKWLRLAANQGHEKAETLYGIMYKKKLFGSKVVDLEEELSKLIDKYETISDSEKNILIDMYQYFSDDMKDKFNQMQAQSLRKIMNCIGHNEK